MGKDIVHHGTLTSSIAGSRTPEGVIAVLSLHHEGAARAIGHACTTKLYQIHAIKSRIKWIDRPHCLML